MKLFAIFLANLVNPRRIRGIFLLSFFLLSCFHKEFKEFFVFSDRYADEHIWPLWTNLAFYLFNIYALFKGFYCVVAGGLHLTAYAEYQPFSLNTILTAAYPHEGGVDGDGNEHIDRLLDYRSSKIAMMTNPAALSEVAKTAGLEVMAKSNSSYAKFLNSQLSMMSNSQGYEYAKSLFGSKK